MKFGKTDIIRIAVFIGIYILLGNARSVQPNPIIPDAVIAVNMIVPVLAGILYGRYTGLSVGLFGTLLNVFTPAGNAFELAAIIPHAIMGYSAGYIRENTSYFIGSSALVIGHLLNLIFFIIFKLLNLSLILNRIFWLGLAFEIFIGILAVIVITSIYRLGFQEEWH